MYTIRKVPSFFISIMFPAIVLVGSFVIYPVINGIYLSFTNYSPTSPILNWVNFENYIYLLGDPEFWEVVRNTLVIVFISTLFAVIFGFGLALLLVHLTDGSVAMAEKTAYRNGFGDQLAEGSRRLTARFGQPDLFMGVRGQEFPAYDGRAIQGMGLGYATSNRGACHLKSYTVSPEILGIPEKMDPHTTVGKAEITKIFQDITSAVDATGLCLFLTFGVGLEDMLPQLVAATGVSHTLESLTEAGERIWNLERLWNERAGVGKGSDTLPKRILHEPIPSGPAKGLVNRLGEMLPEYYRLRGWSEKGEVTPEKRKQLGLDRV